MNDEQLSQFLLDSKLGEKVREYASLVEGRFHRWPAHAELMMNIAYGASHGSKCLKRQVGAVIARGPEPISQGYNENPDGLKPCIEGYGTCLRDIVQ